MTFAATPLGHSHDITATVSVELIRDWIESLEGLIDNQERRALFAAAGIREATLQRPRARLTKSQIVSLYKLAAAATSDEMMGLWSRPIRPGALKFICRSVIDAANLPTALHRLTQVWNLLLDDYRLEQRDQSVLLWPRGKHAPMNRFGHALMMKLVHGIVSWLAGYEVSVTSVAFAFPRPPFGADYDVMFPAPIFFDQPVSGIAFPPDTLALPITRKRSDISTFLERAPEDWIFTQSTTHLLTLRIRQYLLTAPEAFNTRLDQAAQSFGMSERSLTRKLASHGDSFQSIKERLRRDIALRELSNGLQKIEVLSDSLGYSAPTAFHRSFRRWTGLTPGEYRDEVRSSGFSGEEP